ncbi:MAG TPA: ribonuclease HII [Blastocatellia bacterium]|jgi:ribonuclease HII
MAEGYALIAGADEVGRGAMAGPLVAAAVILDVNNAPDGIDDSKKLTRRQRERLASEIKRRAVTFSITRIEPPEIDRINIHRASLRAMGLAVKALHPLPEYVLIDGKFKVPDATCPQMSIIKGDGLSISIAAASIIAKVARDEWMREYDVQYPVYGFARHVGYCTPAHKEAVARFGPSPIHRMSFQYVHSYQYLLDLTGEEDLA